MVTLFKNKNNMDIKNLVVVSGLSGVHKIVSPRGSGLIIQDMISGKRKFVSIRKHQFSPLESIAIFTDDGESTELKNVFRNMLDQIEDNPPISPKSSSSELREYFLDILPNHDQDQVHIKDIKKIISWFTFLNDLKYWDKENQEVTEEDKKD